MPISGSTTIEIVGAGYFGSTLNITGAVSGASTVSCVGAITTAGGLNLQGTGITNVGTIAGLTNISGSGTFQSVGAATFGTTIAATGSISGSSTLSCVGAITTAGGLNLQDTGITNAGAIAGATDITATGDLTITGDAHTLQSANSTDPLVIIKNTNSDANGARLRFVKDKGAAGAANDVAGIIEFYADDASQDQVLFSEIKSQVAVHTNGQEGGKLTLSVASHDGETQPGLVITDGSAEDEVDVTIGNGADSLVTIAGDLDIPNGGFALGSDADGDIYYRNSNNLQRLAKGSDSQVLTLASGVPSWADASAGNTFTNLSGSGTLQAVGATTFGSTLNVSGNVTFGLDDTGVDVRIYSATTNEGVLYDASEDELALLLTTKLKFHDVGGGEEIYASSNGHLEINAGTTLDMTAPTVDINASTAVTIDGPSVVIASSTSEKPSVEIKNTNADANGPALQFTKNGTSVADNDVVGNIAFVSEDDGDNVHMYAAVVGKISDMTGGAEGGTLEFKVAEHDGTVTTGLKLQDGNADGEIDVTIGAGADSLTTIAGDLDIPNGGFALGSDADGDIYYRNSNNLQRLAKGDDDQVLTLASGVPTWAAASAGSTFTNLSGSGTLQAVGAVTFGNTLNVSGNATLAGTTSAQGVTFTNASGSGTLEVVGNAFFGAAVNVTGAVSLAAGDGALQFTKAGENSIKIPDNQGSALVVEEANNAYMTFDTTNSSERIKLSQHTTIIDDKKLYFGTGEDWSIEYDEDGDDALKMAGTTFEMNAETVTFTAETSTDPLVIIKNYTNDANGARLRFVKDKGAAGAANDVAGIIEFYADDANQDQVKFSEIKSQVKVHTNGQEGGKLTISVAENDGTSTAGLVIQDGDADGELDVTIGAGAASVVSAPGFVSGTVGLKGLALTVGGAGNRGFDEDAQLSCNGINVNNGGISNVGALAGVTNLSGSGTLQAVGNAFMGAALNVTGNATVNGSSTLQGVTFTNASGSGTLEVVGHAFYNADVRASGSVLATTSLKTPLIEYTDGDDAITIGDGGTVTFSNTVKLVDDKTLIFGSNDDWTIEYDEDGTNDLKMAGTSLTVTADTATFQSTNAEDPLFIIKNTSNDATGPRLRFVMDKGAAGSANDVAGKIEFFADDASEHNICFAAITGSVAVHTNGQEGGKLTLSVASHDGETQPGLVITDGDVEDEVDATIGNGAASTTTVAGNLSVTTNSFVAGYTHYDSSPADTVASGVTATFTAGEDLETGECVYFKSDGKMWKAVATAVATTSCVAMATADISADATGVFLLKGFLRADTNFPTWTVGGRLYTPEAETSGHNVPEQTAPDTDGDFVQVIGWAVDGNTIYFCPDSTIIEVA